LLLRQGDRIVETVGLVDSSSTINVLPYELGLQLGSVWDDRKAIIRLTGNLGNQQAIPCSMVAQIGEFEPVKLVFAIQNHLTIFFCKKLGSKNLISLPNFTGYNLVKNQHLTLLQRVM